MRKTCEWHIPEQQQERRVADTWDTEKTTKGLSGKLNFCLGRSSFLFCSFTWLLILSLQSDFCFKVQCKEWHEGWKTELCQDKKSSWEDVSFLSSGQFKEHVSFQRMMKKTFDPSCNSSLKISAGSYFWTTREINQCFVKIPTKEAAWVATTNGKMLYISLHIFLSWSTHQK